MRFRHPPGQLLRRNQKNCILSPSFVSNTTILNLQITSVKRFRDPL
jgi:hypothetical protein